MSNPLKITFLSNNKLNILYWSMCLKYPVGAFEVSVVNDAQVILEETDFEDPATVIYLDMSHPQSEFVLKELHRTGVTQKSAVVILWSRANMQNDEYLGKTHGARFITGDLHPNFLKTVDFFMKLRGERGLA